MLEEGIEMENEEEYLICPRCDEQIPSIDFEKTTRCSNCNTEWAYDMEGNLREVEEDDNIYYDR